MARAARHLIVRVNVHAYALKALAEVSDGVIIIAKFKVLALVRYHQRLFRE